jgi:hypothetical protein
MKLEPVENTVLEKAAVMAYLKENLPPHKVPKRIEIGSIGVGHRFKKV